MDSTPTQSQVFNESEADVILQSSDNVEFRTYKSLLALASPMFHGMFSLPAPQKPDSADETRDGLPVVQMTEDSLMLEKLLMFCHPAYAPTLDSLDEVKGVIAAAKKYGMAGVEERTARFLRLFVTAEPLRVYCIAWNFQLEEEVRLAAKRLLASPLLPRRHVKELNYIPAIALHRLEEYHYNCQRIAKTVALVYGWINTEALIRFDSGIICYSCTNGGDSVVVRDGQTISARNWWTEYMSAAAVALQERPCGATVKDPELLNKAFRKAAHCGLCRDTVFTEMMEFCELFAREVDRTTDLSHLHCCHPYVIPHRNSSSISDGFAWFGRRWRLANDSPFAGLRGTRVEQDGLRYMRTLHPVEFLRRPAIIGLLVPRFLKKYASTWVMRETKNGIPVVPLKEPKELTLSF